MMKKTVLFLGFAFVSSQIAFGATTSTEKGAAVAPLGLLSKQSEPNKRLSEKEMEQFLLMAEIVKRERLKVGITGSERATLSDGNITHDAHIQTIDQFERKFRGVGGVTEFNFRDSYKFNIAAYQLDRLIGLDMVPVSVERKIGGKLASVTWWEDDIQMMERERYTQKIAAPDPQDWNDQMYQVRVFNELLFNTDPNLGNLLITNDWDIRLVDFTRSFRTHKQLRSPKSLVRIDRRIYDGLRSLDLQTLRDRLGPYLKKPEIPAVLARRDRILEFFNQQISEKGESAVVCDLPGH